MNPIHSFLLCLC